MAHAGFSSSPLSLGISGDAFFEVAFAATFYCFFPSGVFFGSVFRFPFARSFFSGFGFAGALPSYAIRRFSRSRILEITSDSFLSAFLFGKRSPCSDATSSGISISFLFKNSSKAAFRAAFWANDGPDVRSRRIFEDLPKVPATFHPDNSQPRQATQLRDSTQYDIS